MGDQLTVPPERADEPSWINSHLEGVLEVQDVTLGTEKQPYLRVRGRLLIDSRAAYQRLAGPAREHGFWLLMRRENELCVLMLARMSSQRPKPRLWVNALLAAATVVSVLLAYALFWSGNDTSATGIWRAMGQGLGFAAGILGVLLAHEMGHYFAARRLGVSVTLPFLVPFPLSPMGTMGAVISLRDPPPSRRAMLLIGMAGPLAGLLVAVPVLLYGLHLSPVMALPVGGGYVAEGNSLLYLALKWVMYRRILPAGGLDVDLHPLAFAGWAGLLVTSFNLIPAGQLDGGHIAAAALGPRARLLVLPIVAVLLLLGIWWQGWLLWAALIWLVSRRQAEPLDDITPLTRGELMLAAGWLAVFALVFIPIPLRVM